MKRKSILLSLLLAIFVVGGMFAQEPTYSKMSPLYTYSFRQISEERYGELVVEEFYLGRLSLGFREGGDG